MTNVNINELKVAKWKTEKSLMFFTRYFFKKRFNRKFVVNDHHEAISDALQGCINGTIKKLIINIGPRYGKTELAVKNFIAYGLALSPSARFIHLSYSDDLALDNSEDVKNIVKGQSYQQLFPNVQIKPNSDSKKKWYTTMNGGVYATSAAGQVTGFGAGLVDDEENEIEKFGGALIIDDPIKPEDADSDTVRNLVNQRFDSTIANRVNSRKTPIIIIMQRLHEDDLCGYLLKKEPGEWTVISLPCIKSDGTALWPFKHTIDELHKMEKDNPIVFGRQYMQNPKPLKGMLFNESELQYFKPSEILAKSFETSIAYTDVADGGEDSTSVPIARNVGTDIYITDVLFNDAISDITIPLLTQKLKQQQVKYIRVESNNMGAMYGRNLQKETSTQVLSATSTQNKHTRILMDAAFIIKHCKFLAPEFQSDEYKKFMKELTGYLKNGKSKHDDAPDSLSGLVIFIRAILSHLYL